jgi:hypothetical protein
MINRDNDFNFTSLYKPSFDSDESEDNKHFRKGKQNKLPRRGVIISDRVPRKGRPRIWGFGYADFAELLGTTPESARQLVLKGKFNPADLRSICEFWRNNPRYRKPRKDN